MGNSLVGDDESMAGTMLAAIVESADDAIVSKNLDGIITSWNGGAGRIFGYTAQEAVGKPITIIIPPELHSQETYILQQLRAGHRIDHFETERVTKDGKRLLVSLTISPIRNSSGQVVGASKIARDITKIKEVERELRESQRKMKFSLEAGNFGTWYWDFATGNVHWSDNMEKVLGVTPGSFGGTFEAFLELIKTEDRAKVEQAVQRSLEGDGKYHVTYRQRRADGGISWMEAIGQVTYDDANCPTSMMGVCRDITERRRFEDELKEPVNSWRCACKSARWSWSVLRRGCACFPRASYECRMRRDAASPASYMIRPARPW